MKNKPKTKRCRIKVKIKKIDNQLSGLGDFQLLLLPIDSKAELTSEGYRFYSSENDWSLCF